MHCVSVYFKSFLLYNLSAFCLNWNQKLSLLCLFDPERGEKCTLLRASLKAGTWLAGTLISPQYLENSDRRWRWRYKFVRKCNLLQIIYIFMYVYIYIYTYIIYSIYSWKEKWRAVTRVCNVAWDDMLFHVLTSDVTALLLSVHDLPGAKL